MRINAFLFSILFSLFLLSGCAKINQRKASKPQKPTGSYVFTRPDNTHYRVLFMPNDKSKLVQGDEKQYVVPFDSSQVAKRFYTAARRPHPELTASDLKAIAAQHQLTLVALANPSSDADMLYSTAPFLETVISLEDAGLQLNQGRVAVVLVSSSYDLWKLDRWLNSYRFPYQSYVLPAKKYSEKILLKNIFFIKELCPECWQQEKDDVAAYRIFLLDPEGKVIDKLSAPGDQKFYYDQLDRMADYAVQIDSFYTTLD